MLNAQEPRITGGKLQKVDVTKSWPMNDKGVTASRGAKKFSSLLSAGLDAAQKQIDARAPKPATFRNVGGHWTATQQNGWTLDREATKQAILKAILAGQDRAEAVVKVTAPTRSVQVLADRGVLEHVSTGTSSFKGSPAFRVTNVLVGAQKLDNFFVAPGHTFDFAKEVGDISASTGFVKGYVISGGTLEKEDGGGICQVSTTIFRAMYQAGLPIVERHEHSHRVEYYDPVGFEATVYAPAKNLRMKNDTARYLFVQASWDRKAQTLRFDLFGTKTRPDRQHRQARRDGLQACRHAQLHARQPRASRRSPPAGRAGAGHDEHHVRTIKASDGKVTRDTLKSVYKPWGAVYGVAPGDARLK